VPAHKHYRQKWVDAGYDVYMGSAWVCIPPPADLIRLYHFTTADHAMSDIENGHLKVARFADCNDPFELLALNFRFKPHRTTARSFKKEFDNKTGFISFSKNWTQPLMWSHYADRHKGVCLGFDVPKWDVITMKYEDERILEGLDKVGDDPNKLPPLLQDLLMRTKAKGWEYEQEVRRFVKLKDMKQVGDLYFYPFSTALKLREVIIGDRCALKLPEVRAHVASHQPDAISYNARLAFKSFAIVPIESTIP
jgi:hypothetical protein